MAVYQVFPVLDIIFGFLDHKSLRCSELVSKTWKAALKKANYNQHWKVLLQRKVHKNKLVILQFENWVVLCNSFCSNFIFLDTCSLFVSRLKYAHFGKDYIMTYYQNWKIKSYLTFVCFITKLNMELRWYVKSLELTTLLINIT